MNTLQAESMNEVLCKQQVELDKKFWLDGIRDCSDLPPAQFKRFLLIYLKARWVMYTKWN